jgi:hypothetical protein
MTPSSDRSTILRLTARLISQASLMASLSNWRACSMIGRKGIQPAWLNHPADEPDIHAGASNRKS